MTVMGTFRCRARPLPAEDGITLVAGGGLVAAMAMWLLDCKRRNAIPTALRQRSLGG